MQRTQNAHCVAGNVVDQDIVFVGNKFSGVLHAPKATDLGVIGQTLGFFGKQVSSKANAAAGLFASIQS